ncbi:MAG: hypothetical protein B6I25_04255, partial [Planctomycetales bacterium 4572_13]
NRGHTAATIPLLTVRLPKSTFLKKVRFFTLAEKTPISNDAGIISSGEVTVDGSGSIWTNSDGGLKVGYFGSGTLNVINGGAVVSSNGSVVIGDGNHSAGIVTVDGSGSTLTISRDLRIGYHAGTGVLNITNGGAVIGEDAFIASELYTPDSTGIVTVDGFGSTWIIGALTIGVILTWLLMGCWH